ncbi:hypothetical protein AB9K41_21595, partial [Cribrihabitans sp. XS_ASV171]
RFEAAGGDVISLASEDGAYGRLIDPFGREVFYNRDFEDITEQLLRVAGTYTLLVEGFPFNSSTESIARSFTLEKLRTETLPAPSGTEIELGSTIDGNINQADDVDEYVFTLDEPGRIYFDQLASGSPWPFWTLSGPRGIEVENRPFYRTNAREASEDVTLDLPAGTYQLSVFLNDGASSAYS